MAKRYARINWQDYPSTATPRNATNLNKMDKGIDDLDDAVETINNNLAKLGNILSITGGIQAGGTKRYDITPNSTYLVVGTHASGGIFSAIVVSFNNAGSNSVQTQTLSTSSYVSLTIEGTQMVITMTYPTVLSIVRLA